MAVRRERGRLLADTEVRVAWENSVWINCPKVAEGLFSAKR